MIVAHPARQEPLPHRPSAEQGVALALEKENRESEDLAGVLAGRYEESRPVVLYPLPSHAWPAAAGQRTAKQRPDDLTDFAVRQYLESEGSLEQLVVALYHGNVSVSRAEKTVRALWGGETNVALVSRNAAVIEQRISAWLRRPVSPRYHYVFLQRMPLKVGKGGTKEWRNACVAVGVSAPGLREVLAISLADPADDSAWTGFFDDLRLRGFKGADLFIGDPEPALVATVAARFPGMPYQVDLAQLEHALMQQIPVTQLAETSHALAAIWAAKSPAAAKAKLAALLAIFRRRKNVEATQTLRQNLPCLHGYARFPRSHWGRLQTNRPFVGVLRDCREWIRIGGAGTSAEDLLLIVAARWRHAARGWARRKFLARGA